MRQKSQKMEKAFLEVYEQHSDGIFRYCFFRTFDRELSLDLTQEAFMRTWREIAEGKDIDNLKAFVYKVMRNLIIDNARKKKAVSLESMQTTGFDVVFNNSSQLEASIDIKTALKLLEQLDEKYREVIIMRHVDGLSPKEIARILGESENVVSIRISRGLKQLRELMNHE